MVIISNFYGSGASGTTTSLFGLSGGSGGDCSQSSMYQQMIAQQQAGQCDNQHCLTQHLAQIQHCISFNFINHQPEIKAIKLLKEWLSPSQLAQYEEHNYFDVIGSDTGRKYRILNNAYSFNVLEISNRGSTIIRYCFVPEGTTFHDTQLAQKIALETNEKEALKIANTSGRSFAWLRRLMYR
jgi:hypothetical protein